MYIKTVDLADAQVLELSSVITKPINEEVRHEITAAGTVQIEYKVTGQTDYVIAGSVINGSSNLYLSSLDDIRLTSTGVSKVTIKGIN